MSGRGLQSIGNGYGFSPYFDPYGFILNDFNDFRNFAVVFEGVTISNEMIQNICRKDQKDPDRKKGPYSGTRRKESNYPSNEKQF